jgi:LysR family transcriptional regulator, transcriptional activator of nhaA
MSLKVGVVNVLSKLVVRKILAPALKLPQHVHLVCYENKSDTLLADLLVHRLDIVLSDSPVQKSLNIKTYSRLLGECGITFFAGKSLARSVRFGFPQSLDRAPMLLPLEMTALRQSLERWFECLDIMPTIVGEFEDRELLEAFGQNGDGVFAVPSVIEEEMGRQYNVELVGRTDAVRERFYAISFERIVKHPAVTAISDRARKYFGTDKQ